jgi:hypothetical protein
VIAVIGIPGFVGTRWHDAAMRYLVEVPNFGEFAAPGIFAEVARRAEETGWDAMLVWDHVVGEKDRRWEIADPWILLTTAALATRRIRLGTAITPVARRRPSKLAREVATLDRLTGSRMILGAGLGAPVAGEYGSFGDTTDTRVLAERLDEGLHALDLLWSGEPVTYQGNQVTIDDVVFLPTPVQRPRVPVWVGGIWPNKAPRSRPPRTARGPAWRVDRHMAGRQRSRGAGRAAIDVDALGVGGADKPVVCADKIVVAAGKCRGLRFRRGIDGTVVHGKRPAVDGVAEARDCPGEGLERACDPCVVESNRLRAGESGHILKRTERISRKVSDARICHFCVLQPADHGSVRWETLQRRGIELLVMVAWQRESFPQVVRIVEGAGDD